MTSTPVFLSRFALLCSCVVVFFAVVVGLCGANALACVAVLTTDGAVAFSWIAGACALGAVILRLFRFDVNRALFLATAGGLGLGLFSLLGLGLGLLGWLNRPIAISLPTGSIILFVLDLIRRHPGRLDRTKLEQWLREPAGAAWIWLLPIVSLAIACVAASIMPGILWKAAGDPHPYDVTGYHLLVPREWYEGGRIVPLDHNVFSYFPFNVEMQFLLLMHAMGGPFAAMYACQFVSVGYALLMVAAVHGAVARKGKRSTFNVQRSTFKAENDQRISGRALDYQEVESSTLKVERWTFASASMPIAAAFAASIPWVIMLAGVAYVESALMLYTALAIGWALCAINNSNRLTSALTVAGMMAGFACGVKITAVPMLLLAVPVAVLIVCIVQRLLLKRAMLGCCVLVLTGSIVLSPWLIRNFIWSRNPLFPVGMSVLGKDHFTDQQVERFRATHSPTPAEQSIHGKLNALWKDVISHWQYGFIFLPVALLGFALRWRDPQTWLLFIVGVFVLVTWIGFTHLIPRFLVMIIPIGAIAIGQIRWGRAWPVAVVLVLGCACFSWAWVMPELCSPSAILRGQPATVLIAADPAVAMPPELITARDAHMQIGLVGDAQAFLYEVPMSQMHYRSVFNLSGNDPIEAWVGPGVKGNPDWFLVVNPSEIDRLHRTYVGVPGLPPEWPANGAVFYLRSDALPK